jgi:hypothetical protein
MKRRAGAMSKEYWPPLRRGPRQRAHQNGACDDRALGAVVGYFE